MICYITMLTSSSAGITDSALTNHGVIQANRLGQHLADVGVNPSHIFSSDLQRAFKTAEAIRLAQPANAGCKAAGTKKLAILREQDFGFYERKKFFERPRNSNKKGREEHYETHRNDPGFVDVESKESMQTRCDQFLDGYLINVMLKAEEEQDIVIVAHGIILSHLWRCILRRSKTVVLANSEIATDERAGSLEHLGSWSNTGYLELSLLPSELMTVEQLMPLRPGSLVPQVPTSRIVSTAMSVALRVTPAVPAEEVRGLGEVTALVRSRSKGDLLFPASKQATVLATACTSADEGDAEFGLLDALSTDTVLESQIVLLEPRAKGMNPNPEELVLKPVFPVVEESSTNVKAKGFSAGSVMHALRPTAGLCHDPSLTKALSTKQQRSKLWPQFQLTVHRINCTVHLNNLKKTKGGIGSLKHDEGQKSIDSFFKKRNLG